jgi:hypothetical protein
MKKIGILTFHRSINYGAFMQCYSLAQQLIKRYGNIVEVIDFDKASKHNMYYAKQSIIQTLVFGKDREIMRGRFQEDLSLLPLSDKTLITDDYEEVLRYINGRYDIIIVGSDAVWAYNKGLGLQNPYWLFGDELQCEKFSYAASAYSLNQSSLSGEDKNYIGQCLKSFSYIGVRDQETENLVKMCLPEADVYRNCDPTVLLDKPDVNLTKQVIERQHLNPKKKLVTVMMGLYEPIIYDVMHRLGRKDFEFVYLYSRMKARERFMPNAPHFLSNLSPFEWYHIFGGAYLNLTTYFHGTLLALKSNVPTITFDTTELSETYKTKIQQVTQDLGLSEFFNSYKKGISKDAIFEELDIILNNHEEIASRIGANMLEEAKKSQSFFTALDRSIHR